MRRSKLVQRIGVVAACTVVLGAAASLRAAMANFDSMSPQVTGPSFVDGGIRFFDSDNRIDGTTPFFGINDLTAEPPGSMFSPPNVLAQTGSGAYSRFGECKAAMAEGSLAYVASVDVFYVDGTNSGNTISLEALRDGAVVMSDFVVIGPNFAGRQVRLEVGYVSGPAFDTIRIIGRGNQQRGTFGGCLDNVRMDIPAPGALGFGLVLVGVGMRRKMR